MIPAWHELRPCPDKCGKSILWTKTEIGMRLAVDAKPHPDGNQACWKDGPGAWRSRSLDGAAARPLERWEHAYKPHVATCAKRKPVQQQLPVPGLDLGNVVQFKPRRSRWRRRR